MNNAVLISGHNIPLHLQEASWVASILSMGCFLGKDTLFYTYPGWISGYILTLRYLVIYIYLDWISGCILVVAYLVWISGCILAVGYLVLYIYLVWISGCILDVIPYNIFTWTVYQVVFWLAPWWSGWEGRRPCSGYPPPTTPWASSSSPSPTYPSPSTSEGTVRPWRLVFF